MIFNLQVEKEPMNVWSPRADLEAGDSAFLPVDPQLAIQVSRIHFGHKSQNAELGTRSFFRGSLSAPHSIFSPGSLTLMSSLGRYVFGSEISYNKAPPRLPGLGC